MSLINVSLEKSMLEGLSLGIEEEEQLAKKMIVTHIDLLKRYIDREGSAISNFDEVLG